MSTSAQNVSWQLFYRHFFTFEGIALALFRNGGALAIERNTFEQIHGALELGIMRVADAFLAHRIKGFQSSRGALEGNIAVLVLGHGHDDVRGDAFLVNHFMARGVIFGSSEAQGGAILQGENALDGAFAEG